MMAKNKPNHSISLHPKGQVRASLPDECLAGIKKGLVLKILQ